MRGTFANIRLKNLAAEGTTGGFARHVPSGEVAPLYDVAMRYADEGTPLVIVGGKEYGTGSSRDWAAKGTRLLGIKAVIVESFERIHRLTYWYGRVATAISCWLPAKHWA